MVGIVRITQSSFSIYTTFLVICSRTLIGVGGRKNPIGREGKGGHGVMKVKQGPALGVPRNIPGTTKVTYTNRKGRTFDFTVPVSQITHPQIRRESSALEGWQDIDTSFSDIGDLEDEMPSIVDECLNQHVRQDTESGECVISIDEEGLRVLLHVFVKFCKDYVLMDVNGMKTLMSKSELNSGPNYEMYDRKSMRKRYWLTIRRCYENIKELIWPSSVLEAVKCKHVDNPSSAPLLSCEEMLEGLIWLEAASTFCVRKRQPYDNASDKDFLPINLSREVQVLARCVLTNEPDFLKLRLQYQLCEHKLNINTPSFGMPSCVPTQAASDRFISCAALCLNHGVSFHLFFANDRMDVKVFTSNPHHAFHLMLATLPTLYKSSDVIRVLSILLAMGDDAASYRFSSAVDVGNITSEIKIDKQFLQGLVHLCDVRLFQDEESVKNFSENELALILKFIVLIREQNKDFFNANLDDEVVRQNRSSFLHFSQLVLKQCRHLLYRLDGPQTSVMNWDEEYIPFVDHQRVAEKSHPLAHVHYKIGIRLAQGLRFARLRSTNSAVIVELLDRLEAVEEAEGVHTLVEDLVQHIAHKVSMSKDRLCLKDATRVLRMLAKMMKTSSVDQVKTQYAGLLSAISTATATELRDEVPVSDFVELLEGLAMCHFVPISFKQLEMVLLRRMMHHDFDVPSTTRVLHALAKLFNCKQVPQSILQAAATVVLHEVEETEKLLSLQMIGNSMELLHTLYFCHYHAYSSLVMHVVRTVTFTKGSEHWPFVYKCSKGALITLAGTCITDNEDYGKTVCTEGVSELMNSLQYGIGANPGDDLLVSVMTLCAAFGTNPPMKLLRSWADNCQHLHALCTPSLAVSVLESLENLNLSDSRMYYRYLSYTENFLVELSKAASGHLPAEGLEVAARVLYLSSISSALIQNAIAILKCEIQRIVSEYDNKVHEIHDKSNFFEKKALFTKEFSAHLSARLVRYTSALERVKAEVL